MFVLSSDVGSAFNQVFQDAAVCGPDFVAIVNETVTSLINQYLGNGQCDKPCQDNRCYSGSTCVETQDADSRVKSYKCNCPPGYTGKYCSEGASLKLLFFMQSLSSTLYTLKPALIVNFAVVIEYIVHTETGSYS